MAMLGRIFLVITLLSGIGAIFFGMEVKKEKIELIDKINTETNAKAKADADFAVEKKAKDEKIVELKKTEGQLGEANTEIDRSKTKIAEQDGKIKSDETKLESSQTELADVKNRLQKVKDALPSDIQPEQIGATIKALQDKAIADEQEKTVLSEKLQAIRADCKNLEKQIDNKPILTKPEGRVLQVNEEWNFVVLDIGSTVGLSENTSMLVYRGGNLVGKLKVTSVEPSVAVADILPEWRIAQIMEGDMVAPSVLK